MNSNTTTDYPRTYGFSLGWRLFLTLFGVLFGLAGLAGPVVLLISRPHSGHIPLGQVLLVGAISLGFAAAGFYAALSAWLYRVILTADSLEVVELFQRRRVLLRDLQGRRTSRAQQGPASLVVVPNDTSAKQLKIPLILSKDQAFDAWIARLDDLDRQELEQSEREVTQALYSDRMPEEREARIAHLKRLAKWANLAALALCIPAFFLPDHHGLLIECVIALPWIAVLWVARFQPLYRFGSKPNDAHPDLTALLIMPGIALAGRVLTEAHTLDWSGSLLLAGGGALALSGAALRADPWFRQQRATTILACALTLAYGFGAGSELNILADSNKPTIYPVHVLAKRRSQGSKSATYYLQVEPWGPFTGDNEITVSASRYWASHTGDTTCVYLGKGAFHIPWFQIRDCPDGPISK